MRDVASGRFPLTELLADLEGEYAMQVTANNRDFFLFKFACAS